MTKFFRLVDKGDATFDDVIVFDDEQDITKVEEAIERVKKQEDYTFEDILKALDNFGGYYLTPLENIKTFKY